MAQYSCQTVVRT